MKFLQKTLKTIFKKTTLKILTPVVSVNLWITSAHAQSQEEWVKPASALLEALESGFVQIGAIGIGIAVIAFGIWTTFTGEPNWKKLFGMIFGGILIMTGPEAIRALLESAQ